MVGVYLLVIIILKYYKSGICCFVEGTGYLI